MQRFIHRNRIWLPAFLILAFLLGTGMAAEQLPESVQLLQKIRSAENHQARWQSVQTQSQQGTATTEQSALLRTQSARKHFQQPDLRQDNPQHSHFTGFQQGIQIPATREVRSTLYGSGEMAAVADSVYFNYLTGDNGNDTLDMDVMITQNEGTNFGNEGLWIGPDQYPAFTDPSLLYFYSPFGSLDTVAMVPTIDDTSTVWTDVSWDWQGGNNGQPLAVGNLWVIYTRTTAMYVVMEVTDVDPWGGWFAFDYMIQTDGSNIFDEIVIEPITLTVNDSSAAELPIGSNPWFDVNLGNALGGELYVLWDADHDGMLSDPDIVVDQYLFMDNDMHDEDPDPGFFSFIYSDDMADGLNYVTDDFIFAVFASNGAMAAVPVSFFNDDELWMGVSGAVFEDATGDPLEGVVVWVDMAWDFPPDGPPRENGHPLVIDITDSLGNYELMVPDSGFYVVGSFDHLYVTDGLVPDPRQQVVFVDSLLEGINFFYREPETTIEGTVTDEFGSGIPGITVHIDGEGFSIDAQTDEGGYYSAGVDFGEYNVDIDPWSCLPDYLAPSHGETILAGDFAANIVDFTLFSTNEDISGTVLLDGSPAPGVFVWGWNEIHGVSFTFSDEFGDYSLPVHTSDIETYYDLGVQMDAPDIVQVNDTYGILAGAFDVDILLETVTGGMEGLFLNADNGEPILNDYNVGMVARSIGDLREEYYANPDPETGAYTLPLPEGLYEIMAGGEMWMGPPPDTVLIAGDFIPYDIYLMPYQFDGTVEGQVMDDLGMPIPGAMVDIGSPMFGDMQYTDDEGYFHFDLPNGDYGIHVMAEGYLEWWGSVVVNNDYTWLDIYLSEINISGAVFGSVTDELGEPVIEADLFFHHLSDDITFHTSLDPGQNTYWIDLPNGVYDLWVMAPGFLEYYDDEVWVNNDTTQVNVEMQTADAAVFGHVSDLDTDDPISFANILLIDMADSTTLFFGNTDDFGDYYIPVAAGTYALYAEAPGYLPMYFEDIVAISGDVQFDFQMEMMEYAQPPSINFVMDQWDDQGRWVRMQFEANGTLDGPFDGYSIWRGTEYPDMFLWDYVAYVADVDMPAYNLVVPTLVDSNAYTSASGLYWSTFVVTGHRGPWGYWDSDEAYGYSLDNIFPGVPGNLLIQGSGDDFVTIGWDASVDDDFGYFNVYRSQTGDFSDAEVYPLTETSFTDADVSIGTTYYYRVDAVDANGNHSAPSDVVSTTIVSVEEERAVPEVFVLEPAYPNPFNPSTRITFGLPQTSHVTLEVYNLLGQRIRTLTNTTYEAGYINLSWNGLDDNGNQVPSGTYVTRLRTATFSSTQKMVLLR